MVRHACKLRAWEAEAGRPCKLEASLFYIGNSRPAGLQSKTLNKTKMYVVNRNSTKYVVFVHFTQFSTFEEDIRERRNEEGVR